jgi:predicted metal-dependent hydrolase
MPTTTEWRATLRLPGGAVECTIRRTSRARNLRLTIDPAHSVVVTVPTRAARNKAEAERVAATFAADREAWLRRHLDDLARQHARVAAVGPAVDGGTLLFRGELHRLRVVAGTGSAVGSAALGSAAADPATLAVSGAVGAARATRAPARTTVSREGTDDGDELVIRLGRNERRDLAAILEAWLKVRARVAIEREIERHASAMGVAPAAVSVRDARTRWGSCSRAGRLSFSWRLVLAPPEVLETVVIHELAHLRVFGHGPNFWAVVASRRPDHRQWRRWLRDHRVELHAALGE